MSTTSEILVAGTVHKICRECSSAFELPYPSLANLVHVCPTCSETHAIEDQRVAIANSKLMRLERWKGICPLDFLETIPDRLPCRRQLHEIMNWEYGNAGLLLYGPTGKGKSRCAWLVAAREYQLRRSVRALNSMAGVEYAAKFSDRVRDAEHWIDQHSTVELLLLDDVFKARLTDSFESALFTIIAQRTEARLPTIVTANDTGASLLDRMSADRGEPLLRRLRESCKSIAFI